MNRAPARVDFTEAVRGKMRAAWTPERRAAQAARLAADLTGQRFGRLVAIRRLERRGSQGYEWECRCDCGEKKVAVVGVLRSGATQSCGCLRRGAPRPRRRKRPYEHLFNRLVYGARARGIECSLTFEEFLSFVEQASCFYCGAAVTWEPVTVRRRARTNLDRKDNAVGYQAGNVVVCCWECNDGKGGRYSFEEWVAMARALRAVRDA